MLRAAQARLNRDQRERVVELMVAGSSAAAAARVVGCDYRTVLRWWRRWLEDEPLDDQRGGRGRPRETTAEQDAQIIRYAEQHVFCTAGEIKEALELRCSEDSIRSRLHEAGLFGRVSAYKSLLSEENKRARVQYAREMLEQQPAFWRDVVFSDEKTFCTSRHGRLIVYRRKGNQERYAPRNTATRQQSGRCTVHVWGWCDGEGAGTLHRIGRTTAASYKDTLEQQLLPAFDRPRPGRERIVFQQDNAPTHNGRLVRDWMATQPRLELLQWASRSPDLNPIENVWGYMTGELTPELNNARLTADMLWERVRMAWELVTPALCRRLADSMTDRLQEVVRNDGAWTHY